MMTPYYSEWKKFKEENKKIKNILFDILLAWRGDMKSTKEMNEECRKAIKYLEEIKKEK